MQVNRILKRLTVKGFRKFEMLLQNRFVCEQSVKDMLTRGMNGSKENKFGQ